MTGRILITGATGFIGRKLVEHLRATGSEVRTMSRHDGDGMMRYPADGVFVAEQLRDTDAIVHLAAFVPPRMDDPSFAEECFRVNALHTLSLLTAAAAAGVGYFLYLSSGNVYAPSLAPRREGDLLYPDRRATHYLLSKMAGEIYTRSVEHSTAMRTAVLRPSSVYGPGMQKGSMLSEFVSRARDGRPIALQDGGRFGADFVFVDDVVEAIRRAVALRASGIFNAGSGERTTALQAATIIFEITGRDRSGIEVSPGSGDEGVLGFGPLDMTHSCETLEYHPVPLRAGLQRWLQQESA